MVLAWCSSLLWVGLWSAGPAYACCHCCDRTRIRCTLALMRPLQRYWRTSLVQRYNQRLINKYAPGFLDRAKIPLNCAGSPASFHLPPSVQPTNVSVKGYRGHCKIKNYQLSHASKVLLTTALASLCASFPLGPVLVSFFFVFFFFSSSLSPILL